MSVVSRITVIGSRRRVDLVVPADVPVADLLPDLVRYGGADGVGEWTLARPTSGPLPPQSSLADAGVRDGDVLVVRDARDVALGPVVVEPIDTVLAVTDRLSPWTAVASVRVAARLFAVALCGVAALVAPSSLGAVGAVGAVGASLSGGAVVAVVGLAVGFALHRRDAAGAALVAGGGCAGAAVVGLALLGSARWIAEFAVAAAGVAVVAVLACFVVVAFRPAFTGLAGAAGVLAACAGAGSAYGVLRCAAVAVVVAVAVVPVLPRLALRRVGGSSDVDVAHQRLAWWHLGVGLVVALLAVALAWAVVPITSALAGVAAVALLLRARDHRSRWEVGALVITGGLALAVVLALGAVALAGSGAVGWAAAAVGVGPAVALGLSLVADRVATPGWRVALAWVERVVLLALVPLLLGVFGVFGDVVHAGAGLR